MKKYSKGEIAKTILLVLAVAGTVATVASIAVVAPNAVQLLKYFLPKNYRDKNRISKSVSRLKANGLLIEKKRSGVAYFHLSPKGDRRASQYHLETMKIQKQKKWDGFWRIILFDIPEKQKQARRALNFSLKKLGCIQYQKSVFLTPFPCEKEIRFATKCFTVQKHVQIITASAIDDAKKYQKIFQV